MSRKHPKKGSQQITQSQYNREAIRLQAMQRRDANVPREMYFRVR
ncbi:hypothetical protein [Zhihengliuella flava]|uniref:Uncharacterized protein n=1 Tax=Zhihengliuella flava TaxID=1285193 RepID=A0A931D934_9MICC|nr:hypothetical protein [Zhihengliuella flava]MBG6084682.1 hypothetical protein [Zhihengliuella flava]